MYTFRMAVQPLAAYITIGAVSEYNTLVHSISRAALHDTIRSDALYYGTAENICTLLNDWNESDPISLVFCEICTLQSLSGIVQLQNPLISWAYCSLSASKAGDSLISGYFQFHQWFDELQDDIYHRCGLSKILQKIAFQMRKPIFFLNSGYRLLASDVNYSFEDQYIQELLFQGCLSDDSIQTLFLNFSERHHLLSLDSQSNSSVYDIRLQNQHYAITCEVRSRHSLFGYLFLLSDSDVPDLLMQDYALCALTLLLRYNAAANTIPYESNEGFSDFVQDLLGRKFKSMSQLKSRASKINLAHLSQYFCVLIHSGSDNSPTENHFTHLIPALQQIFPHSKSTIFNDELLFIVSTPLQKQLFCNTEQLRRLAEKNNVYICLGSGTISLGGFPTIYQQTRSALHIGMKLSPNDHVILWETYQLYQIIELCHFHGYDFHQNNLVYLCSPRYVSLLKHDRKAKDNLCTILKIYLENDCNATQTAKALFLHRNTLINKLDKIEHILGVSLNNCRLRFELYFSLLVADYTSNVLESDIMQLRFEGDSPSSPLYFPHSPA